MKFQTDSKKIGLEMIVDDSVPQSVFSDAKRIKQILFNIIGNAIKFTFKGKIAVSATYNQSTSNIDVDV